VSRRRQELQARIGMYLGRRASRDTGFVDRLCRWLLARLLTPSPEEDFLRDPWIDGDRGFDPDELDRYQRGEGARD
jgi:hypothetical protein